jgi:hypothetical protein
MGIIQKGRPRKQVPMVTILNKLLTMTSIEINEYIKKPKATAGELIMAKAILSATTKDNPQLLKLIIERVDGKIPDSKPPEKPGARIIEHTYKDNTNSDSSSSQAAAQLTRGRERPLDDEVVDSEYTPANILEKKGEVEDEIESENGGNESEEVQVEEEVKMKSVVMGKVKEVEAVRRKSRTY